MKLTSRRNLALELSKRPVNISEVGKGLNQVVKMWESRKEIIIKDSFLYSNTK